MKGLILISANLAYAITTTSVYFLVLKENLSSQIAPILVAIAATSLLSLSIRFGGNEYVLSVKDFTDVKAVKTFFDRPISFTIILWLFSAPLAIFYLIMNGYNWGIIFVLVTSIIIQPLGSILETIYYISDKSNVIIKSKIFGMALVIGFYIFSRTTSYSNLFILILFGFASSIYVCLFALRSGLLTVSVMSYTDFKKYVLQNYKYASLSLIYILPLAFDKIYISYNSIFEYLVIYDFQFKIATLFEVIVLGPLLGLYARNRALHLSIKNLVWISLIAMLLITCLLVAKETIINIVEAFEFSISEGLRDRFILPVCFAYVCINFITNIIKQKLIFAGYKDELFLTYLCYGGGVVLSFLIILPQSIFQVAFQLAIGAFCLLLLTLYKYQQRCLRR